MKRIDRLLEAMGVDRAIAAIKHSVAKTPNPQPEKPAVPAVRRFAPIAAPHFENNAMREDASAPYVLFSDYEAAYGAYFKSCVAMDAEIERLKAQLTTLEAERDALNEQLKIGRAADQHEFERVKALEAENQKLREAANRFEENIRDVAGQQLLNWRLCLGEHCKSFRAVLSNAGEGKASNG